MRILALGTDLSPNCGWGRYTREVVEKLPNFGISVDVCTEIGSNNPDLNSSFIAIKKLLLSRNDRCWKEAFAIIDRYRIGKVIGKYDLVQCFTEPFIPLTYHLHRTGVPTIVNAVGTYSVSCLHGSRGKSYHRGFLEADQILSISSYTTRRLLKEIPELESKVTTVPLGVNIPISAQRELPPFSKRQSLVLSIGALKPRKGNEMLIRSFTEALQSVRDAKLVFVGTIGAEPYHSSLLDLIHNLKVGHAISFVGQVSSEALVEFLLAARLHVLPSINYGDAFEGFGLVHLEANAFGVPSIGCWDTGNEDAILDGQSGSLVQQGNVSELASRISNYLMNEEAWNITSKTARLFAEKMNWDEVVKRYIEVYKRVIKS